MIELAALLFSPLMDGRCDEYDRLDASRTEIHEDVSAFVHQDKDYLWICHTAPSDRPTWDDVVIYSPSFPKGLNLHASAQLGQWPGDQPGAAPADPDSDLWWNVEGWWANISHPNNNNGRVMGREFQLSKDHFGRGAWRVEISIGGVNQDHSALKHQLHMDIE